jgi:RNA polymerase-binding transcription factor DksA
MADVVDLAQDKTIEFIQDRVGGIRAELSAQGVVDGFCEDCDCLIPTKRLLAAPWARRCVVCQENYEAETRRG